MLHIYKKKYDTCLQMLDSLRIEKPELKDETLSYAGVLDPMAEGWVPVLIGKEENQNRVYFTEGKKRYQFDVLVGVSTDTDDLLGLVDDSSDVVENIDLIKDAFLDHPKKFNQTVSMFSNKKHKGKPLWEWGRAGVTIPENERPSTMVEIFELRFLSTGVVSKKQLQSDVELMAQKIKEGFRVAEVRQRWEEYLSETTRVDFQILSFDIYVSKGFYIRKLVEDVGVQVNMPLMVYGLKRTEIVYNNELLKV